MIALLAMVAVVLLLVLLEGFFSGSETALTSASRTFLHSKAENGDRRAALAEEMLASAQRFLATTLTGTNLAVVSSTTIAQLLVAQHVPEEWASLANTIVMTPLILIVGELIPKSIARAHADVLALHLARPLRFFERWILRPLVWFSSHVAGFLAGFAGRDADASETPYVTRDDLLAYAELATEQGVVTGEAGAMLCTVFDLDSKPLSAVMVPLVDVVAVPSTATVGDVEQLSVSSGLTRFPVYKDRIDEITGVIDVRQLLYGVYGTASSGESPFLAPRNGSIEPFVQHEVAFVPEMKSVGALLHELRYQKIPMAVAVDEHGGVVGVVTREDLVEEVVGEIHDERDALPTGMREVGDSVFECDGKVGIREAMEQLDIEIETNGFETVAGLVLAIAGRIPAAGEIVHFQRYEIEVLEVCGRRLSRLRFRPSCTTGDSGVEWDSKGR